jgi:hypothetical protein
MGSAMALTPAAKQAAYRRRLKAAEESRLETTEATLREQAARCEELSDEQRAALADKLDDMAMRYLWRSKELAQLADKVRPLGWHPPGFPP